MSKAIESLEKLGKNLVSQLKKQENPTIEFNVRSLSNIEFSEEERRLMLGSNTSKRSFFNAGHAKKFMQTLEEQKIANN